MKKILVLSFVHEDPLILKELELLKKHYNKIIDYFGFPIKYYGVKATEEGETRIDEENSMIWLHTDNFKEYDKKLTDKVVDCFRFIEESCIDYDIIIKGNTSTYLNLIMLNNILQHWSSDNVYTGVMTYTPNNLTIPHYGRGNCLCIPKKYIDIILNTNIEDVKYKMQTDMNAPMDFIEKIDDVMFGYIWKLNSCLNICQISCLTFGYDYEFNIIDDVEKILKVGAICYKIYNINYYNTSFLNMHPSIMILKLLIKFMEKHYIINNMPTHTVIEPWFNKKS